MKLSVLLSVFVIVSVCTRPVGTHTCANPATVDIAIFVEDMSATTNAYFDLQKDFIKDLIHMTTLSSGQVQVAVTTIDNNVNVEVDLNDNTDNDAVDTLIDAITFGSGSGNYELKDGFAAVFDGKELFDPSNGGRTDVPQYLLFFVSQKFDQELNAMERSAAVHKAGMETVVIAGPHGLNSYEEWITKPLASDPSLFLTVADFGDIKELLPRLEKMVCIGPPEIVNFTAVSTYVSNMGEANTTVRFHCLVDGNEAPFIRIYGKHTGLEVVTRVPRSYAFIQEADVTITIQAGQSDEFVCTATNTQGSVESNSVLVLVNGPPEFHGTPNLEEAIMASAGSPVTLSVDIRSQPAPTSSGSHSLTRTSPGAPVTMPSDSFAVTFQEVNENYGTLAVTLTSLPDDSVTEYRLTVDNGHGTLDIRFTVVNNNVVPQVTAFTANSADGTVTVAAGDTVTFHCEAAGSPTLSLTGRDSSLANVVSLGSSTSPSGGSMEWSVVISSHWSDVVTCTAVNDLNSSQRSLTLVVTGPPILHQESDTADFSTTVRSDGGVSITFDVISHPAPVASGYILTFQPPGQSEEIVPSNDYETTFMSQNALYGKVQLEFTRSLLPDVDIYSYLLTVDNGQGQQLDIPFTAVYLEGPPTLEESGTNHFVTELLDAGSVVISFGVNSRPAPSAYSMTHQPRNQSSVLINRNDYTATYMAEKGRVQLEFTMTPKDIFNVYVLTVHNGLGRLEIPFTVLDFGYTPEEEQPAPDANTEDSDDSDSDSSKTATIVVGCVLGGVMLVALMVQTSAILTLYSKVSHLQKDVETKRLTRGRPVFPTMVQPSPYNGHGFMNHASRLGGRFR